MKAIDELNQKFGKYPIHFGIVKTTGSRIMKQTGKSQSYTINWQEILVIQQKGSRAETQPQGSVSALDPFCSNFRAFPKKEPEEIPEFRCLQRLSSCHH